MNQCSQIVDFFRIINCTVSLLLYNCPDISILHIAMLLPIAEGMRK